MSEISCGEVLRDVERYLDGELEPDRAVVLAHHLRDCGPCFRRAEFQRRLKEIVRAKCRSQLPDHLSVRIRHLLRSEATRRRP